MLTKFLLLAIVGKVTIYAIQKFPLTIKIKQLNNFLYELIDCDFCLGCWTYFIVNWLFFGVWFENVGYVPVLSQLIMGIFTSFVVHLVSLGWRAKFEVIVLE